VNFIRFSGVFLMVSVVLYFFHDSVRLSVVLLCLHEGVRDVFVMCQWIIIGVSGVFVLS